MTPYSPEAEARIEAEAERRRQMWDGERALVERPDVDGIDIGCVVHSRNRIDSGQFDAADMDSAAWGVVTDVGVDSDGRQWFEVMVESPCLIHVVKRGPGKWSTKNVGPTLRPARMYLDEIDDARTIATFDAERQRWWRRIVASAALGQQAHTLTAPTGEWEQRMIAAGARLLGGAA